LAGPARIAIIYLVSGIGGYLASATFVPFRAEVCFQIVNYFHKLN
jgi:hypothetical protein